MAPAITTIRGPGALRRHVWDFRQDRTLCGRHVDPNRAQIPGQIEFVNCRVCLHQLDRAQGELLELAATVGSQIFEQLLERATGGGL